MVAGKLRKQGWAVSFNRVQRARYKQAGLCVRTMVRKRRGLGSRKHGASRLKAERHNHGLSYDFIFDQTSGGRHLKWLPLVDKFTKENLALEVDRRLESGDVLAKKVCRWIQDRGFQTAFIPPWPRVPNCTAGDPAESSAFSPYPVRLSVIVPAYNCADYLERCLRSLLAQKVQPMEIIVCDDCSTDGTADLLNGLAREHRNIRLLSTARHCGSPAVPRNIGLAHANGEYVGFVDADDWVDHEMFGSLLARASTDKPDIVSASFFHLHEGETVTKKEINYGAIEGDQPAPEAAFQGHFSHVMHRIYRMDFLRHHRITFPFLSISEDYCFSAACHLFATRTRAAEGGWYHYNRDRPGSTTQRRQGAVGLDNINFFFDGIRYFEQLGLWSQYGPFIFQHFLPSLSYTYSRLEDPYRRAFRTLLHGELASRPELLTPEQLAERDLDHLRNLEVGVEVGPAFLFNTEPPPASWLVATANRLYEEGDFRSAIRLYRLGLAKHPTLATDLEFIVAPVRAKAKERDARFHWLPTTGGRNGTGLGEADREPRTSADRVTSRFLTWPSAGKIYEGGRRARGPQPSPAAAHETLVTIITTVRNDEAHIGQCLASVREQSHPFIEHLVIDAASTDDTLAIIRDQENTLSYILSEPDEGIYAGINKGVQLASGEYIIILNSDDYLEPDGIATLVDSAEKSGADLVFGSARIIDRHDQPVGVRHSKWNASVYIRCPARHGAMLARATAYNTVGLYDATWRVIADMVWMQQAYACGLKVELVDQAVFNFRPGRVSAPESDVHRAELLAHLRQSFPGVDPHVLASLVRAIRLTGEQITAIAHAYPGEARLLAALAPLLHAPNPEQPPALPEEL